MDQPPPYPAQQQPSPPLIHGQQPGYAPQAVGPRPVAPPLTTPQKRTAFWAGFVSTNVMVFGSAIASIGAVFGLLIGFLGFLAGAADSASNEWIPPAMAAGLAEHNFVAWIVGAVVVGLALVVAGILASHAILRGGGVARPWAVTWSSIGILIPVMFLYLFVGNAISQVTGLLGTVGGPAMPQSSGASGAGLDEMLGTLAPLLAGGLLFSAAVNGIIGWLIWWWMAHVLRPGAAA